MFVLTVYFYYFFLDFIAVGNELNKLASDHSQTGGHNITSSTNLNLRYLYFFLHNNSIVQSLNKLIPTFRSRILFFNLVHLFTT